MRSRTDAKCRIGVFASGTGSNLQALMDYEAEHPEWPVNIAVVVSDKPHCKAIERAQAAGIPVFARPIQSYENKAAFETDILHKLKEYKVELLVLAGYMRLVGPTLLQAYPGHIINIHPSLLPAFPGRTSIRDALAAGVPETGVTVHFVDEGMDTGPVIAQRSVMIEAGMTEDMLSARIHAVEHELYPVTIGRVVRDLQSARN